MTARVLDLNKHAKARQAEVGPVDAVTAIGKVSSSTTSQDRAEDQLEDVLHFAFGHAPQEHIDRVALADTTWWHPPDP